MMNEKHIIYHRIMVAVDGSDASWKAAHHAIALAGLAGAELVAVAVIDAKTISRLSIYADESLARQRADVGKMIDHIIAEAERDAPDVNVTGRVEEGSPKERLIQIAEELKADLLVCGAHGWTAIESFLLGSVSDHLVRHAPCPVLVVREVAGG